MVMLGVACMLFFPVLAGDTLWGQPVVGFVSPVAASVVCGAFLFGLGLQLGGGIASISLHGWLWIAFALLGTWAGLQLRPADEARTPTARGLDNAQPGCVIEQT